MHALKQSNFSDFFSVILESMTYLVYVAHKMLVHVYFVFVQLTKNVTVGTIDLHIYNVSIIFYNLYLVSPLFIYICFI